MDISPNRATVATVVNTKAQPEVIPGAVPMSEWGKDHWSTFAYIDSRIVDYKGVPDREHMRCDPKVHPGLTNTANRSFPGGELRGTMLLRYFVRKVNGSYDTDKNFLKAGHDDWSCCDDFESAGLMANCGTGIHPVFKLTPLGEKVADQLRAHKRGGGAFAFFKPVL